MRKIAVFTGTRADYGLLFWLMKEIEKDIDLILQILASGAHLAPQYGETWKEIEADGFKIDAQVEMLLATDSSVGVVKSMGLATIGFADALSKLKPDILVILGDRFEALSVAQAALIMNIPIAHLHGGELTLGAYDNSIRHAITKMASLHFVATEEYRRRVIQMGEESNTVFNVGAPGLEHVCLTERFSVEELSNKFQIPLKKPYFLVTYHPETLSADSSQTSFETILKVLDEMTKHQILFTWPNADNGGQIIIQLIEKYCKLNPQRAFGVPSLGSRSYLSAVAHSDAVIGNSSSGIIEVPSLGVPVINIGLRQKGRMAADSVIHTPVSYAAIKLALNQALESAFRIKCKTVINPYGDGRVSQKIVPVLKTHGLTTLKYFQDLDFNYE